MVGIMNTFAPMSMARSSVSASVSARPKGATAGRPALIGRQALLRIGGVLPRRLPSTACRAADGQPGSRDSGLVPGHSANELSQQQWGFNEVERLQHENEMLRKVVAARLTAMRDGDKGASIKREFLTQHEAIVEAGRNAGVNVPAIRLDDGTDTDDDRYYDGTPPNRTLSSMGMAPRHGAAMAVSVGAADVHIDTDTAETKTVDMPAPSSQEKDDDDLMLGMDTKAHAVADKSPQHSTARHAPQYGTAQQQLHGKQPPQQAQSVAQTTAQTQQQESVSVKSAAKTAIPEIKYNEMGIPIGYWPEDTRTGAEGVLDNEEKRALRAAAKREVDQHDGSALAAQRGGWLMFTVPEKPVAGVEMVLYYNRACSEALRQRPRVLLTSSFNAWELDNPSGSRIDLVPSSISRSDGSDWWSCKFQVPTEAYEMNYVFSDGDGVYDNNNGQDFWTEVAGGSSRAQWLESRAARAAAAMQKRQHEELVAARLMEEERLRQGEEDDLNRARARIAELKNEATKWRDGALSKMYADGTDKPSAGTACVWRSEPSTPVAGKKVKLMYNLKATSLKNIPVPEDQSLTLRVGHNGWRAPHNIKMTHSRKVEEGAQWFEAEVEVAPDALVLNFVVNYYEHWDNNGGRDYRVLVDPPPKFEGIDDFADSLLSMLRTEEREERVAKETAERRARERREEERREAREKAMAVQRRQIKHVLFTAPETIKCGELVTIYYNPSVTPLNGQSRIYLIGGWNRWSHWKKFGPIEMIPPGEGGFHWQASVRVPEDAYMMDFVFSNVPSGDGIYDNRGQLDYHLPVTGSMVKEAPLHVVHISVEMAPIAKVGGLGDVVTSLARAVQEQGHLVEIVLPRYDFFMHSPLLSQMQYETEFDWGGTKIYVCSQLVEGVRVFFIEPKNGMFNVQSVYGRFDDEVRFDFFCKAALEFLLQTGRQPDILHCHDWSTAHVAKAYWDDYHCYGLWKPKVVFTIHNLNYGQKKIGEAAYYSQRFTTVSPTYAFETGSHAAIAPNAGKFMGIRNGIDNDIWDPETDQFLPLNYNADTVEQGKAAARKALRDRLGLQSWGDKALVGVVSRLTNQKGIHLIKHAAWRTTDRGAQFVLLGSAPDPKIQGDFNNLAASMGGSDAAFYFAYDEPLSHLVYAACDIIVVPSMFEPCGLTQLIAMRFGAIPVVRHTGGLKDTVFDVDFDKGRAAWHMEGSSDWQRDSIDATNGFAFEGADAGGLDYALNRALDAWYNDKAWFRGLQARVMRQDWTWNRPALEYIDLYYAACK